MPTSFQQQILTWYQEKGRKDLPWQQNRTPYRVWVSEIMLQQTQVKTVIPYFQRFIVEFPDVKALAEAPLDTVLHYWTGLGYYARARNLHKAAQILVRDHQAQLPQQLDQLQKLPGIGRSTAAAILSFGFALRGVILDGNIKRVLIRMKAMDQWAGASATLEKMWHWAEFYTPKDTSQMIYYNQAMMDLGAMVCTRSKPQCTECPIQVQCQAYLARSVSKYPVPGPKRNIPIRTTIMLVIRDSKRRLLLQRRDDEGLWGGLWEFPQISTQSETLATCRQLVSQARIEIGHSLPMIAHRFSHFQLNISPVTIELQGDPILKNPDQVLWYSHDDPKAVGLSAPVKKLLQQLRY